MFRLTKDAAEAAGTFNAATVLLGEDPRDFVHRADIPRLQANFAAQILCVTQALAAYSLIRTVLTTSFMVVGYSVGEVAAWGIAGLTETVETLELARLRACLMDEASQPGDGLVVVRGLSYPRVQDLADKSEVEVAIVNPEETIMVGGDGAALHRFCEFARAAGAMRCCRLPIAVASHTTRMSKAAAGLRARLTRSPSRSVRPGVILLSGIEGLPMPTSAIARELLAQQMYTRLAWAECLQAAIERGGRVFLELGPGTALRDMVRAKGLPARSSGDFATPEGLRSWVRGSIGYDL